MPDGVFGYKSLSDFAAAVEAAGAQMGGREAQRQHEQQQRASSAYVPDPALQEQWRARTRSRLDPPSEPIPSREELLRRGAELAGPEIVREVEIAHRTNEIGQLLEGWVQRTGGVPDGDVAEQIAERLVATADPALGQRVADVLYEYGLDDMTELVGEFARMKVNVRAQEEQEQQQKQFDQAMSERQALLQSELDRFEPPVAAVVARAMEEDAESVYLVDDPLVVQLSARAMGEQSRAQRKALDLLATKMAMDPYFKQYGAPGSRTPDSEREKWERELEQTTLNVFDEAMAKADAAPSLDRAEASLLREGRGNDYARAIIEEAEKMSEKPEHQTVEAMRQRRPEDYIPTGEPGSSANGQIPTRTSQTEFIA